MASSDSKGTQGARITLDLLDMVERDGGQSQRRLASELGIALGLVNAYLKRCVRKGLVKVGSVPAQRYRYYLTPQGFAEKARLTADFLAFSFQFYRDARADLVETMKEAAAAGHRRIGVLGDGELAEIATIVSEEMPIEIVGFVSSGSGRSRIGRRILVNQWSDLDGPEAALLACVEQPKLAIAALRARHPEIKVYVPKQLKNLV